MQPRIVLAMSPGLVAAAFDEAAMVRLTEVGKVLDPTPLDRFDNVQAARLLAECDVLLGHWGCPQLDAVAVGMAHGLRHFAYAAGTVKGVISPAVFDAGITVTSSAAANAVPVAEYTVAAIVLANKGAFVANEQMRDPAVRAFRPRPLGNWAKQIGIIGASHVGRAVVTLLAPYHLSIAISDPYLTAADAAGMGATLMGLRELMATSDIVSLHAPDLASTRQMIGAGELAAMKDGATFVNTARGAIVDHAALLEELRTGRIAAVLDVTDPEPLPIDHELRRLPNAFLTPHIAGSQGSELARLADLAITEIERFGRGEPPLHPVTAADLDRIA